MDTFTEILCEKRQILLILHISSDDIAHHNDKYHLSTIFNSLNLLFGSTDRMHS